MAEGEESLLILGNFIFYINTSSNISHFLALAQDRGFFSIAPVQYTKGFGHTKQLQVGKGMTLLAKAVSQVSTDLNTNVELAKDCHLPASPLALLRDFFKN